MAIQMRRGQEVNFDADKMLPGEWAVSLDSKIIRMCFAPGVCVRMATYDAFEIDMAKIEAILAECQTIEEVVTRINTEVSANAQAVAEYTSQAKQYRDEAESFKNQAAAIVGVDIATEDVPGLMAGGDNAVENGVLTLTKVTTNRTLNKSEPGGIRIISMDGVSQQKQYSGKNLLPNTGATTTLNGVTFAVNADKSITVKGTATASATFTVGTFKPTIGNQYIFTSNGTSNVNVCFLQYVNGNNEWKNNTLTWTATTEDVIRCQIYVTKEQAIDFTYYPMIRLASVTDATYEPYVGGISSPNPEYKQDVDSVEISEIGSHGKNFLKNTATSGTIASGITFTVKEDKSIAVSGTSSTQIAKFTAEHTLEDGEYILSGRYNANCFLRVMGYISGSWTYITQTNSADNQKFTMDNSVYSRILVQIIVLANASINNAIIYPMIRKADVEDATYQPYTETRETLSAPIVLRGIGDAKDRIVKKDGVYGVLREYKPFTLDGTQKLVKHENADGGYRFLISESAVMSEIKKPTTGQKIEIMSTMLRSVMFSNIYNSSVNGIAVHSEGHIALCHTNFNSYTAEELQTQFASKPMEIIYPLATPTFEPLPLADQIALHRLKTFKGVTYLYTNSTIIPIIEWEGGTSVVGGYALEGLNSAEANRLELEQLKTLTNELATQIVAGSEG